MGHAYNGLRPSENGRGTEEIRLVTAVWGHGWGGRGMTRDDKGHSSDSSHEHSLYLHNGRITEGERKGNGRNVKMSAS